MVRTIRWDLRQQTDNREVVMITKTLTIDFAEEIQLADRIQKIRNYCVMQ